MKKQESRTVVYILFHSTTAVSLAEGLQGSAFSTAMPGHGTQCAYVDCKRTTDKRAFGHVNTLTAEHQLVYSTWLKSSHDGVVCNSHYIALRRQLTKQQQAQSVARMAQLLAAPAIVDSISSPVLSSPIQVARSSSLPAPVSHSVLPPPAALARSTSMPLLRGNHRRCDARQRKRIAFTCVMSGVTWTSFNRLEANLNSHSLNKSTWYTLTQHVWETVEAVKADCETTYAQQLVAANQPIVVMADGAWSHPGFTAGQHEWVLMNAADNKAIFSIPLHRSRLRKGKVVHEGNYDDGSSKGMEGYALDIALSKLQSTALAPLITGWVGDQDSSVLKQLRQCLAAQRWEVHLDPGHAKKNLYKALQMMFGEKQAFDGLAARIPVFIMRLTKRAEKEHAGSVANMRVQFLA